MRSRRLSAKSPAASQFPAHAQVIILVEDSVKFYSSFLPIIYTELWKQGQALETETMHQKEKMLRRYSRPKARPHAGGTIDF